MDIPAGGWWTPENHPFKDVPKSNWILPNYERKSGTFHLIQHKDMLIPCSTLLRPSEATLEKLYQTKCLVKETVQNSHQDMEDAHTMVLAAKNGNWSEVFGILNKKRFLVNVIPVERAWAALHQAAYLDAKDAVQKLLAMSNCDNHIRTKRDRAHDADVNSRPVDIAKKNSRWEMAKMLTHHVYNKPAALTFLSEDLGNIYLKHGVPYFVKSIGLLRPDAVNEIDIPSHQAFYGLIKSVQEYMKRNWRTAKDDVGETLYPFGMELHRKLQIVKDFDSFCECLLKIYTKNHVYKEVNQALRRASHKDLEPSGDDWLLGVYSTFLEVVILYYHKLTPYTGYSYRGGYLDDQSLQKYQKGTTFYALQFSSSSSEKYVAENFVKNVLFVIDNRAQCETSPKCIQDYSQFPQEREVLYPSLTKFKVTDVKKPTSYSSFTTVYLELIPTY